MHNALVVLLSSFFFASSTTALYFPQFRLFSASKTAQHDISDKCTFTLWHKQLCSAGKKTNYIQMFEIEDHTNDIIVDIAALRPASAHNSYTKIGPNRAFAVRRLLDDKSLVIGGSEVEDDEVLFNFDGTVFTSDGSKNSEEAWCDAGAWDNENWNNEACNAHSHAVRSKSWRRILGALNFVERLQVVK
ncbi:hypothetical protein CC86DRAFT_293759 [Ophiobolus disseminans]|uniref:Uncharacterized protein n=1 Tax=Ophiobolus disseminans TaxID=1469910 RepID=A0A6A7A0A8_9PLEO|nr:hypothetical protein CC86DRAFT_293759 [Ophiobolus disseminans]